MRPHGNIVGIAFDNHTVGETEEDARFVAINGVVVDIGAVNNTRQLYTVGDRFVIARDNFDNRHVVATLDNALCNTRRIDGRRGCAYEK